MKFKMSSSKNVRNFDFRIFVYFDGINAWFEQSINMSKSGLLMLTMDSRPKVVQMLKL